MRDDSVYTSVREANGMDHIILEVSRNPDGFRLTVVNKTRGTEFGVGNVASSNAMQEIDNAQITLDVSEITFTPSAWGALVSDFR